jgi:hypothetical protein
VPAPCLPRILASLLLPLPAAALAQNIYPPARFTITGHLTRYALLTLTEPSRPDWTWGPGRHERHAAGLGPMALVVRQPGDWTYGAQVAASWSFGGADDRPSTRGFRLQPIASYRLSPRHAIGYGGTISADWDRHGGRRWIVPLGLAWSTLSRPRDTVQLNAMVGAGYNLVRPEHAASWFLRFQLNLILPGR